MQEDKSHKPELTVDINQSRLFDDEDKDEDDDDNAANGLKFLKKIHVTSDPNT